MLEYIIATLLFDCIYEILSGLFVLYLLYATQTHVYLVSTTMITITITIMSTSADFRQQMELKMET